MPEAGGVRNDYDEAVTPLDVLALIGEIVSWIGFGAGVPLLLSGWTLRFSDGTWEPVEIAVVRAGDALRARWFAGGDFRERRLRRGEAHLGEGWHRGYASSRRPDRLRFVEPPATARVCLAAGWALMAAGLIGLVASWIPAFL
ncbi:hypothetical protein [Leucobacter sp. wl10]|uniref:hypothetical protein n=1 Tax=Leucobacter sp. wl10 TaxID=2304677 RepID=UPI000E5B685B|nr:hypothetical protein [Leucobacter sp. wl10]RGE23726.1 hypothetical protein D1J51_01815 [Leucobacter sp. wl10]